jgi:hypothetical protein
MRPILPASTGVLALVLTASAVMGQSSRQFTVDLPPDPVFPTEAQCRDLLEQYNNIRKPLEAQHNQCSSRNRNAHSVMSPRCEQSRHALLVLFSCATKQPCVGLKDAAIYVLDEGFAAEARCMAKVRAGRQAAQLATEQMGRGESRSADRQWLSDVNSAARDVNDARQGETLAGAVSDKAFLNI